MREKSITEEGIFRLTLEVPLPPAGVNHAYKNAWRFSKTGQRYMGKILTDDARQWKNMVGVIARAELKKSGLQPIFRKEFSFDVRVWWKNKRSQLDCDGALKLVQDSMNGIVYSSDKFCLPRVLEYNFDECRPRMEIVISCPPTSLFEVQWQE